LKEKSFNPDLQPLPAEHRQFCVTNPPEIQKKGSFCSAKATVIKMNDVKSIFSDIGVVPVIKLNNPETDALPLAEALIAGGIPIAEVTFRAAGAETAIKLISESYPDMAVGAGTVICEEQVDRALAAGARFIVSPGFDIDLVRYCISKNVPVFPGCTTASEYQLAIKAGLDTVKFFPAEQSGGLSKIKALSAPFPQLKLMPTGGISLKNLKEYLSCKCICACGGSYMVSADLIDNGRWDEITELCRQSVEIVKEARNNG